MNPTEKPSILIIGAGAAGLMAAYTLADRFDVTLLEALDRPGGRIRTIPSSREGVVFEAGAEFVHGKLPLTEEWVKKAGLHLEEITGKMFTVNQCEWTEQDEVVEGWDELLEKMASLPADLTLDGFLETYFHHPKYEKLRRRTRSFAAGFDLADPVKASVRALYREWAEDWDEQYRIREGYGPMIDYIAKACTDKGCRILTGKRVKQIDWEEGHAAALTIDNERFSADKMIVTLPAGVMQRYLATSAINITPPLDDYDAAWHNIGYGSVLKVMLSFEKPFWEETRQDIGFILSDESIPTWWVRDRMLTGWLGGPAAVQWDDRDDTYVLEQALGSLSAIFRANAGEIADLLQDHHIARWHADPAAMGAYSYETPLSAEAREKLSTPVANTLFFAGEALYNGPHPGTVEAALASGKEVGGRVLANS